MLNILNNFNSVNISVHSPKVEISMATYALGNLRLGNLRITDRRVNAEDSIHRTVYMKLCRFTEICL